MKKDSIEQDEHIRVVIAEDHQVLIDGIESFFEQISFIELVGTAFNGEELIKVVRNTKPDVVITDIRMPKMDGFLATKKLVEEFPDINILAFTMFDTLTTINRMMEMGAKGYILKNAGIATLIEAVKTVAKGNLYYGNRVETILATGKNIDYVNDSKFKKDSREKRDLLSKREKQVLYWIGEKMTSKQISEELNISVKTVETHRKNMFKKLGFKEKNELIIFASENKFEI